MFWFLLIAIVVLVILLSFSLFYLYRFARIILVLERDLSDALEILEKTDKQLKDTISLPVFFDSPEVRKSYVELMEYLKLTQASFAAMVARFTERSKNKFIIVEKEEPSIQDILEDLQKEHIDSMRQDM